MLECFYKVHKSFSIGRERVRDISPLVFFIHQTRMRQSARMLRNGLEILFQCFGNPLNRHIRMFRDQEQYLNAAMIRRTLEMPLHLFCAFHPSTLPQILYTFPHSQECGNVR